MRYLKEHPLLLLTLICIVLFTAHLDALWVNIMEARNFVTAREMLQDSNWLLTTLNGEPRYQKPPLPNDTGKIFNYIQRLESGQNIEPQDADLMRRGVQGLASDRQTVNPQAILQLLTLLTG